MKVIINVIDNGAVNMAQTGINVGLLVGAIALISVLGYAIWHKNIFAHRKRNILRIISFFVAITMLLGVTKYGFANASTTLNSDLDEVNISVLQGESADADQNPVFIVKSDSNLGWEHYVKIDEELPAGLILQIEGKNISTSSTLLREEFTNKDEDFSPRVSASASQDLEPGIYVTTLEHVVIDKSDTENICSNGATNFPDCDDNVIQDGRLSQSALKVDTGHPLDASISVNGFMTRVSGGDGSMPYSLTSLSPQTCSPSDANPSASADTQITLLGSGLCILALNRDGDADYLPAKQEIASFTIYGIQYAGLENITSAAISNRFVLAGGSIITSDEPIKPGTVFTKWCINGGYCAEGKTVDANATFTPTHSDTLTANWLQALSMNGASNWSYSLTNWAGGDLIIRDGNGIFLNTSTATNNSIRIGAAACTTTDTGFRPGTDTQPSKIGCVLPSLSAGMYPVSITTDGGVSWKKMGEITYAQNISNMQSFDKTSMQQGEVRLLTDTRDTVKYRVKKMPDGNIWMIDNLHYNIVANSAQFSWGTAPTIVQSGALSANDVPQMADPGNNTQTENGWGYLYNWCAATADISSGCNNSRNTNTNGAEILTTVLPSGWNLPASGSNVASGSTTYLESQMLAEAVSNPVYSSTSLNNFRNTAFATSGAEYNNAPWQGVNSGHYKDGLHDQSVAAGFWSRTANNPWYAYTLGFSSTVNPTDVGLIADSVSIRGVL